jgi:hypothetical protein
MSVERRGMVRGEEYTAKEANNTTHESRMPFPRRRSHLNEMGDDTANETLVV